MIGKHAASILRPANSLVQRTVCVLGLPRSGTTMVTRMINQLGVFVGDELDNIEDIEFTSHKGHRSLFTDRKRARERANYLARIRDTIHRRNAVHDVWGWKDPISSFYIHDIHRELRNPHYVFVTRDLGAVGQSEMVFEDGRNPNEHILAHIHGAAEAIKSICGFLSGNKAPCLLISYERALGDPQALQSAMADFLGQHERPEMPDGHAPRSTGSGQAHPQRSETLRRMQAEYSALAGPDAPAI